jgi:DNA-binding protein Fis
MDFLPAMRKKLMRKRTEKFLEGGKATPSLAVQCLELSIEGFIGKKLDHFFERLGSHDAQGLYETVIAQVERPMIEKTLAWADGNRIRAARVLGMNRNTLRKKIRELKIKQG